MKLLIDIGNTNTSIALVAGKKPRKRYFIHTARRAIAPAALKRLLGADLGKVDRAVIVSVVPKFLSLLKKSLKEVIPEIPVMVVGKNIRVPMGIKYRKPKEVGQDRLVTSFSAARAYGAPVLVVDFGTAVTFDLVNRKGEYDGGLIFPGLRLALEALSSNAALLPRIDLKPARSIIGRDTNGSMNNGVLYGYAAMCDGIIDLIRKKYGSGIKVVATGGDARLVSKYSNRIRTVRPDLMLKGLNFLAGA